ncbi:MAG TPA: TlpA disulfide reductase family protein [Thermoanaerobaculia bacterium]|nr:TlpA disulfide reductase family protein [Thermoanaerobaculia bacterium]
MISTHRRAPGRPILLCALVASLLLLACSDGSTAGGPSSVGTKPAFRLRTTDGRTLGPADFLGQVVVVDFWATWCAPCHIQAQILDPVAKDLRGRGVQFLAADLGEPEDIVKGFLKTNPIPYPVLLDSDSKVSDSFGITALPTLMVIDKKGRLSFLRAGIADGDTLKQVIRHAADS